MPSQEKQAHPEQQESGNLVELTRDEEKEVRRRTALRAEVVFESIRRTNPRDSDRGEPALSEDRDCPGGVGDGRSRIRIVAVVYATVACCVELA